MIYAGFLKDLVNSALIPPTGQGMFEGVVSDNFEERIDQKIFHAEIVVEIAKVSTEMKVYQSIPTIADFINEDGSDNLKETLEANYRKVKQEILALVDLELERIRKTPLFVHLLKQYQHEMLDITITKQDKEYGLLFASITYLDYS